MKRDERKWIAWAVLGGLVLWKLWQDSQEGGPSGLLGTRTMQAINDFKAALGPIATAVQAETQISGKCGVVQASLESNYGLSKLANPGAVLAVYTGDYAITPTSPTDWVIEATEVRQGAAFNLFGFKCGDAWIQQGNPYVLVPTNDYYRAGEQMPNGETATTDGQALKWPAAFRAYDSWEASYRDWARLMQTAKYVADGTMAALTKGDLAAFGVALSKRYAPNQNYQVRLMSRAQEMALA